MAPESKEFPYGQVDCYGMERTSGGCAVFKRNRRPNDDTFYGTDALTITEIYDALGYSIPGLECPITGTTAEGHERPPYFFVSSPNMTWIPDISRDFRMVIMRTDGRFFTHDFTLWPQWYFPATEYMAFVRRKPEDRALATHEFGIVWHDLKLKDFVEERGSVVDDVGRIKADLVDEVTKIRRDLTFKIRDCIREQKHPQEMYAELRYCERGMHFAAVLLATAAQSYLMTLGTFTAFQRYYLEALACYEYLTIWRPLMVSTSPTERRPVDTSLMGALTWQLDVAENFAQLGVPVWLLRTPASVTSSTNVESHVGMISPERAGLVSVYDVGTVLTMTAAPCAKRNRACQALRLANIRLGHAADSRQAGDWSVGEQERAINAELDFRSWRKNATMEPLLNQTSSSVQPMERRKILQHRNINLDKFQLWREKANHVSPPQSPAWVDALCAFTPNWQDILEHPDQALLRGYPVVDAFIFLKRKSNGAAAMLITWMAIRSAWLSILLSDRALDKNAVVVGFPTPQDWKDFLYMHAVTLGITPATEKNLSLGGGTKKARGSRRLSPTEFKAKFNLDVRVAGSRMKVYWRNEIAYDAVEKTSVDEMTVKEVVWDALEHNWRLEFMALDRCIFPRHSFTSQAADDREALLLAVFPQETPIMVDFPVKDLGVAAADWQDRCEYVEAFRVVLSSWKGDAAERLRRLSVYQVGSDGAREKVEKLVYAIEEIAYPFYCKTFFQYFGRAPTVPHRLPG